MQRASILMVVGIAVAAMTGWSDDSAAYQALVREAGGKVSSYQNARAAQLYAQAVPLATNDAQKIAARLGQGNNLAKTSQTAQGRAVLEDVLQQGGLKPDDRAAAYEGIGDSYMKERDYQPAVAAYAAMTKVTNANPAIIARGWAKVGNAEFAQGHYDAAYPAYTSALAIPNVAPVHLQSAWTGMGDCRLAAGRYAEARQAYAKVLSGATADERSKRRATIGIGNGYYEEGDYPAAAKAYLEVVDKNWQDLKVVERLDTIYRRQLAKGDSLMVAGQSAAARTEYEKVLTMEKAEGHHQASAWLGIGNALVDEKTYTEARAAYEKALTMPGADWPDRGRAQAGIARCYAAEGNKAEARLAWENVLKLKNIAATDMAEAQRQIR